MDNVQRPVLATLRITLGVMWFYAAGWKVPPDFGEASGGGLYRFTSMAVDDPVFGPWSWLVEHLILPNFTLFGWMVLVTEATLGALLVLGLGTRLVALTGAGMSLTIFLSVALAPPEWPWSYVLMIGAHLAVAAAAAGRTWGLDGVIRPMWAGTDGRVARCVGAVS